MARLLVTAAALAATLAQADAATLRPMTVLSSSVVRLSDLFDDAGAQAARALGPAPAPGQSITVEAAQLAAIARDFGVDWEPATSGDRAILTRRGEALPRELVLAQLRAGLAGEGAETSQIELLDFVPPVVAPDSHSRVELAQLDFDAQNGRFTASLIVESDDAAPIPLRVGGRAVETEMVAVPLRLLVPGDVISPSDLRQVRVRRRWSGGAILHDASEAEGLTPRRALAAGQPIASSDLAAPLATERGRTVEISVSAPGLTISAVGIALEAGAQGTRVRVLNPASRAVLLAEVTGRGTVRIDPGSVPIGLSSPDGNDAPGTEHSP